MPNLHSASNFSNHAALRQGEAMYLILALVGFAFAGAFVGWIAHLVVRGNRGAEERGLVPFLVAGILGALIGGGIISPLFEINPISRPLSVGSVVVAMVCALVVITVAPAFSKRNIGKG